MTQHQKCDYSVTLENFCAKFCTLVRQGTVNVLIFSEITLHMRNWHNAKLKVRILQSHIVIFLRDVTFCRIISKFTGKKLEVELHKTDRRPT